MREIGPSYFFHIRKKRLPNRSLSNRSLEPNEMDSPCLLDPLGE